MIELLFCMLFGLTCEPSHEDILSGLIKQCDSIDGNWDFSRNYCDKQIFIITYNATKGWIDAENKPDWCKDNFSWDGKSCISYEVTFDTSPNARFVDEHLQSFFEYCQERNGNYLNLPSKCILQSGEVDYYYG